MKAVIYARYSSDLQKDRSIDDQIALCRQIAERHDYSIAEIYTDRAKSAASMFERDGLLALMNAAKRRDFDAVITESLSRLSRDMEDTAAIYKRLKFAEAKIITTEGETTDIHVGVGGIVNSMFLKNLATSVKRGQNGRVREGLVPGSVAYGYRAVLGGKRGEREIDETEAAIVRRIFEAYASGRSLRDIAAELTKEGIPSPNGTTVWNHQKLGAKRGGMLTNQLYIGKLLWNTGSSIKNPETGKRIFRRAAAESVITTDVPHLRIVSQDLWDRVNRVRGERRDAKNIGPRPYRFVNKDRLLVGLLTCATCGGTMMIGQNNADGSPRVVCSYGHRRMNCDHHKSYCLATLEKTVLDGIKEKLTDRAALLRLTKGYHSEWAEQQKAARSDRDAAQKRLTQVEVQIDRYVTAIGESDLPVKGLMDKIKALEVERAALAEKLRLIEAEANVVTLHPTAIDQFGASMEELHRALTGDLEADEAAPFRAVFRSVFERIVVHPTGKRQPYEVTPYARVAAIMGFELFPKMRSTSEMLAEQGVSANRIAAGEGSRWSPDCNSEAVVPLGRWQQAA